MKINIEIVQEAYLNFSQGNIPAMLALMSEGIEWELKDGKIIKHYEYADTAEIRDTFSN